MSQHTPGPWAIDKGYTGEHRYIVKDGDIVADLDGKNMAADARLIAAAPETAAERDRLKVVNAMLLEALEAFCVDYCPNPAELAKWRARFRAAIRAAKGESNG